MREIHFKPPDQARRPTFASDKTKPGTAGNEAGKNAIKGRSKMVKKRGNGIYEWRWAGGDGFVRKLKEVLGACLF